MRSREKHVEEADRGFSTSAAAVCLDLVEVETKNLASRNKSPSDLGSINKTLRSKVVA